MKYRTQKQFIQIVESTINGNSGEAAKHCVEYGFYANDLVQFIIEFDMENYSEYFKPIDFLLIIELATKLRSKDEI